MMTCDEVMRHMVDIPGRDAWLDEIIKHQQTLRQDGTALAYAVYLMPVLQLDHVSTPLS